jgi:hypothetical protein
MTTLDVPLWDALAGAIADVAALHRDTCDLSVPGTPSGMIVMTRLDQGWLEYLVLGDSALVVEENSHAITVITDRRMEEVAPPEYREMLALPTGSPEQLAARIAFVTRQQPLRNARNGYPVASTDPDSAYQALTGFYPASEVRRIALASDGVTRFAEFGLGSWTEMLGILATYGPEELFARIREAEDGDPAGMRWPRAKNHDDVSAVFGEFCADEIAAATGSSQRADHLSQPRSQGHHALSGVRGESTGA